MDVVDLALKAFFAPPAPPGLGRRLAASLHTRGTELSVALAELHVETTARGVSRLSYRRGADRAAPGGRRHLERARAELAEYLAGARTYFTVPVDLRVAPFQARVLTEAARVPFGAVTSYAAIAARVGHPGAARAVGNALGANPVPIIVPCHRVIRGDGTWGHYAFGPALKTRLLRLERDVPVLVGSATTRIVCRRGCAAERRIEERHRVVFAAVDDARSVGYQPCRRCRPERV